MAKIGPGIPPPKGGAGQGSAPVEPAKPFNIGPPEKVPNNLGELMKQYPKLGHTFYKALIMGIAMKMMRDMRKHGKLKK